MEVVRVQSIASCALDSIPVEFIRSEKERPVATTFSGPTPEIPTIDLSNPDRQLLVQGIANASSEWGLFQVVNHGIPDQVIKNLKKVGEEFFELPQEEKDSYANKPEYGFEGYGTKHPKGVEGKIPWVDNFFHNIWPPSIINHNIWPRNPPSYKECNEEYAKHILGVVNELLSFLSLGLGLEHGVLKEVIGGEDVEYLLKINYYPPCPRPDLALGVAPHTDMSLLTVLVPNEVPGLQIFKDGLWFDAKYIPNAIIVHIGDQTEPRDIYYPQEITKLNL